MNADDPLEEPSIYVATQSEKLELRNGMVDGSGDEEEFQNLKRGE